MQEEENQALKLLLRLVSATFERRTPFRIPHVASTSILWDLREALFPPSTLLSWLPWHVSSKDQVFQDCLLLDHIPHFDYYLSCWLDETNATKVQEYYDTWFGPGVAIDMPEVVEAFRNETDRETSPVTYKLASFRKYFVDRSTLRACFHSRKSD